MLGKHITHCEDSLTASVFTHLLHLPAELFWQILRNACYTQNLPQHPGEPYHVEGWPKWNPTGTDNSARVIPDLFMRFAGFDLIIEAKRWDNDMQNPLQWKEQVTAYVNEYAGENQPVVVKLIALGGIWDNSDHEIKVMPPKVSSKSSILSIGQHEVVCPVHMCRWIRLLAECQRMERELGRIKYLTSENRAHRRILADLIELFACHGFQAGTWFGDVVSRTTENRISMKPTHLFFHSRHPSKA